MENIKDKLCVVVLIIIFLILCGLSYYFLLYKTNLYYTQIDNTKVEALSATDDMKYKYTLIAYDENGKAKEVEFKTSRELRNNAYLELEVMAFRGVVSWSEVEEENLPEAVKKELFQ